MPDDLLAPDRIIRDRLIGPEETFASLGRRVSSIAFDHPLGRRWWLAFAGSLGLAGVMAACLAAILSQGVGVWGNNTPVMWALDIVGYDWWIGIASGGLLVSGALLLTDSAWRGAINRMTETVALISAVAAGLFPIIHLGRPWLFYWNLPYPNTLLLWPQFRSPLVWDAFDILSFLVVCFIFWYVGLLPDLATLRDRATERARSQRGDGLLRAQLYGIAALGWRGSAVHWERWRQAHRTLALLGVLLVVSLQTGASVMFAGSVEPGWHDTLLPVSFLFAAAMQGVGVVAACVVLLRWVLRLGALITPRHLQLMAGLLLALGVANLYLYAAEISSAALHGDAYERAVWVRRFTGEHAWAAWMIVAFALLPVHVFWSPAARRSPAILAAVGVLAATGMFGDHFMVIVTTLQHDFLPSSAQAYAMNAWELATFAGSMGVFLTILLLAVRTLPIVSILELRRLAGGMLD
jgi:Ni/Fe-hydrogenase subunit HybB-like protein